MALDNCSILPESEILNNESREEGHHGIPNQNGMASSDSDSGNSIFLTQAVTSTPPLRRVRRNRARSQTHPLYLCEESSDSESEETSAFFELHSKTDSWCPRSCRDKPHSREASVRKRRIHFPFLQKYHPKARLTSLQRQTLVNSSIGGFFQCMTSLSLTEKSKKPEYQDPLSDLSGLEEETEEHKDNQEDMRIVDGALFVQNFHKRIRQEWGSNTRKSPSEVRKTSPRNKSKKLDKSKKLPKSKKLSNAKDVSKGLKIGQSRRPKQSSHSEVKKTRKVQNTKDASKTPEIKQTQLRKSTRLAAKENSTQNLAGHGSSPCSENGKEKRVNDKSCRTQVLETSQAGPNYKAPSHVTSQASDVSDTEDELHVVIAEQTENAQTDIEVSNLQTQSLSLESTSEPQPKTQIQPAMESAVASSQDCELQTVDGDSISLLGTAKKKNKKDCLESPAVDVCSVPRESINISQDTMLSPAPAPETETEMEMEMLSQRKKKHKSKENPCDLEDPVQQESQEEINSDPPEGQRDQHRERKKRKKKTYDALECEQTTSDPQALSPVEKARDKQLLSSQVCEVPSCDDNFVMLNSSKKKKKKTKERKEDVEQTTSDPQALSPFEKARDKQLVSSQVCEVPSCDDNSVMLNSSKKKKTKERKEDVESRPVEELDSLKDANSFSQELLVTSAQEAVHRKKMKKISDGPDDGGKRKRENDTSEGNICYSTDPEAQMLYPKKKKKKRHKSGNPGSLEAIRSEENCSHGLRELDTSKTTCQSACSFEKDPASVHSDTPEGQNVQLRDGPNNKEKRKMYRWTLVPWS